MDFLAHNTSNDVEDDSDEGVEAHLKPKASSDYGATASSSVTANSTTGLPLPSHSGDLVNEPHEESASKASVLPSIDGSSKQVDHSAIRKRLPSLAKPNRTNTARSVGNGKIPNRLYAGSLTSEPSYEDILVNLPKEEVAFFQKLDNELQKIATFYNGGLLSEKLVADILPVFRSSKHIGFKKAVAWIRKRFPDISTTFYNYPATGQATPEPTPPDNSPGSEYIHHHHISYKVAKSRIKRAMIEFYRSMQMLKNYRVSNYFNLYCI
ncbi:hypothetical protein BC937DRAFT_93503 [Endogone sp. FLAS-F59071]|nr:hypothetical protein BC937DRAFT_93503 [Endogone sp. FLAS-F59071]|eukprot:RUS14656.1 hypothetical protein BC937DRAFT_93503 [Endogone sp. FLAS-F59071]